MSSGSTVVVAPTLTTMDVSIERGDSAPEVLRVEVLQTRPGLVRDVEAGIYAGASSSSSQPEGRSLFVFFTGNPGLSAFYIDFAKILATSNPTLDVIVIGFAGHGLCELNSPLRQYPLPDQIAVTQALVHRLVIDAPRKYANYYTGGHSIGSFVAFKMLLAFPTAFRRGFLLTPTICDMAKTPNGKLNGPLIRSNALTRIASSTAGFVGHVVPESLAHCAVGIAHPGLSRTSSKVITHLTRKNALKNVLYLARTELEIVDQLDAEGLNSVADKLVIVFSKSDKWVPPETMTKICDALGVEPSASVDPKGTFPQCVLVPDVEYPHAWCLRHSGVTAEEYVLPFIGTH